MSGYRRYIHEATGLTGTDLAQVEHIMRVERPTLDALDRRQFDDLARRAAAVLARFKDEAPSVEVELTAAQEARVSVPALSEMEGVYAIALGHPLLGCAAVLSITGDRYAIRWILERVVKLPRRRIDRALADAEVN